jgi:hypothetical protein
MSTYLRGARHCAKEVEHYYKHAGAAGYSQARYHADQLNELLRRADDSKQGKNDVPAIRAIIQNVRPMMDEMLKRAKEGGT